MHGIVIFGVGSPIAIDIEETARRLAMPVAAAIRNLDGPSYVSDAVRVVVGDDVPDALKTLGFVLPMFTPAHRRAALEDARRRGFSQVATLVDPTSIVASSAALGSGVYINAGCTIGGAAQLGDFVFINRAASLGHHVLLADFVSIGPGALLAGSVRIDRGAVVGAGAVVLPEVTIGENSVVAAGAVVARSVPPGCVVAGNPARVVKKGIVGYGGLAV